MILANILPAALLAAHLWQSTLFIAAIVLLALALRKNRVQTRYVVWLIASLKCLVAVSIKTIITKLTHKPIGCALSSTFCQLYRRKPMTA